MFYCFSCNIFTSSIQSENSTIPLRRNSPPNGVSQEHPAPVPMAMPHLPITATTKVADSAVMKSPESPGSPMQAMPSTITDSLTNSQAVSGDNQPQLESPVNAGMTPSQLHRVRLQTTLSAIST